MPPRRVALGGGLVRGRGEGRENGLVVLLLFFFGEDLHIEVGVRELVGEVGVGK